VKTEEFQKYLSEVEDLPDWLGVENINVFSVNAYGDTLLHAAAIQGDIEVTKYLVAAGVDLNKQGEHGYTALHEAIEQEKYLCALYLIKKGADLTIENEFEMKPLDLLFVE